jgi:nicotinate-nucleotide pyrophosphorylase (carboxylating)
MKQLLDIVKESLFEDFGAEGDVTTNATVARDSMSSAVFLAKAAGVVAGFEAVQTVFAEVIPMLFLAIGFYWMH